MQEIELKFQIPADSLGHLSAEIERLPGHARERLQAHYFDTPDRRLGQARSALRLRKEGERWVQTLKASGANTMIRLEDNQPARAPTEGSAARIDLSLHLGSPAEASLVRTLGWHPDQDRQGEQTGLVELYRTDIWRQTARVAVGQGTPKAGVVELALDLGHIHAGDLSVAVQELEIELVSGHPMAVIAMARDWVLGHHLWLDTQTKAHRGDRLARQAAGEAAVAVSPSKTRVGVDLAQALEQLTDAMSAVAASPAPDLRQVKSWRQSLQGLVVMSQAHPAGGSTDPQASPFPHGAMPEVQALLLALQDHGQSAALARAPRTTLLCLDLFAALL
ncbi:MAG: CYTH domain-containing protein [Polaromonas sp.]|uniref:CYTH domain-containing protein n=1 Tax=Burkholderiales TaxID=80840 RepID=UPI0024887EE2|nr:MULTISPECIES: CYTH domain-containing protein [Burkholderiales]MDI1258646.1 CYTH domain-containing protein [Aquabacterium sp.]MDI1270984.1 CYTH domain-containing protein [Polaromonas sp.]